MSKYCTKCGAALAEDVKFCGSCGAEVKSYISEQSANPKVQTHTNARKKPPVKIISAAIVIVVAIIGLLMILLPKDSTGSPSTKPGNESNNTQVISDFCKDIQGVWVLSEENNSYASVQFIIITEDMQMAGGTYPGAYGRTCEITQIKQNSDNTIQTELYYPATEATDMDDAMPELRVPAKFDSSDGFRNTLTIKYEDGTIKEFEFVADEFEQATSKFDKIIEEKQNAHSCNNSHQQQSTQTNSVEMGVWCGKNPQSSSCSISNYCDSCRCAEPRCPYMHESRSRYCGTHTCNSSGCNERATDNSSYCVAHKCIKNGCSREKDRNSEYCFAHK